MPKYKYLRSPKWEEIKDTFEYDENGRITKDSYRNSSAHKNYAVNIIIVLPEYDQIVLGEYMVTELYSESEKEDSRIKRLNEALNVFKEFYKRYPELLQHSVCLNLLSDLPKNIQHLQRV